MKLKKLKLTGFKSFADSTKLEFNDGITAIVGPNGCGKSNIADAFRWVLGEQSAKSLRGGKMQDIIFAGTSSRKPLNYAEVTLVLSGIEKELALGYTEVAVTRRVHRSGESEYSINNQTVRLKDIQDLFLDSGIGKNAFSIFEQGKIDQVIQQNPLERRYIFEEAAGILRFLQRKREALRRLEQVELNVSRIKDIHLEVEKQIYILEEQSEKARHYKDNRLLLEELEKSVLIAKWDLAEKKRADLQKKEAFQASSVEEEQDTQQKLQASLVVAKEELTSSERRLKTKNEEMYKSRSEKVLKSQERQAYSQSFSEAVEKEKRWLQELDNMRQKRELRKIESTSLQQQQKEIANQLQQVEAIAKEQREKVSSCENDLSKLRDQQQASQQRLMSLLQKEGRLESDLKQHTIRIEADHQRKLRMLQRKEILSKQVLELSLQAKEKEGLRQKGSLEIDEQRKLLNALEQKHIELTREIQSKQEVFNKQQQELQEFKARRKVLERMRADLEGFSIGSKKLLQESQTPKSALYKKIKGLYEYLTIEKGCENILALAMKPYAQTLVVADDHDLDILLACAKKMNIKDFSVLCLTHLSAVKKESKVKNNSLLINLVDPNEVAFHLTHDVWLTKNKEDAFEIIRKQEGTAAVEEGFYIDGKCVFFQSNQSESNVFMREAELKHLDSKVIEIELLAQEQEKKLRACQETKSNLHQQQMNQDKAIRKAEMTLLETTFAVQRLQGDEKKAIQEITTIESEYGLLGKQLEQLQALLIDVQQAHTLAKAETQKFQKQFSGQQEKVQQLSGSHRHEAQLLKEKEIAVQKVSEENRKLHHAQNVIEVKDLESLEQERRLNEEIDFVKQLKLRLEGQQKEAEKNLKTVELFLEQATAANTEMENIVGDHRKVIQKIEEEIAHSFQRLKKKETEWNHVKMSAVQQSTLQQSMEAEFQERYTKTLAQLRLEITTSTHSIEEMEKRVRSLRMDLEAAGDVNLAAIDECQKSKERYALLNEQIDDLSCSKKDLIHAITELDNESRKIFRETFQKIRENFQKNFQILFNGGEADLEFTDTGDVLESGVDIIARPPGKQMRSIQLMSGGEKCLTAMALLFAIFEVKPSPFCILDEIDAPLDDANVDRFVQMVKHYINRCQFIIITHNKQTMAIADVIFGVSMEERGISKLLSLEFAQDAVVNEGKNGS